MRADLLERVLLVCPSCTWKRGTPASLRLENASGTSTEVETGSLRCVRCSESYPIVQGVAVLASAGHRRVAQETAEVEDPVRLAGPHLLAHYGDLLPPGSGAAGDFWQRLGDLPATGLAVDLSASVGRATLGLARKAAFALGCESSFLTARLARQVLRTGRAPVRVVEEGSFATTVDADASSLGGTNAEFVVAEPDLPPVAPGRAGFVLAANLLERQGDPEGFLRRAHELLAPGGSLAVASPYTWWEEHAPRAAWIGRGEERTRDALVALLEGWGHEVVEEADLLLVLREHSRLEQVVRPHLVLTRKSGTAP